MQYSILMVIACALSFMEIYNEYMHNAYIEYPHLTENNSIMSPILCLHYVYNISLNSKQSTLNK